MVMNRPHSAFGFKGKNVGLPIKRVEDKEAQASEIRQWIDDHFANKVYSKAVKSAIFNGIRDFIYQKGYRKIEGKPPLLTPSLAHELEGTIPEFQNRLAWLLYYASGIGDYGDPHGILAVLSPQSGKVLVKESDSPSPKG